MGTTPGHPDPHSGSPATRGYIFSASEQSPPQGPQVRGFTFLISVRVPHGNQSTSDEASYTAPETRSPDLSEIEHSPVLRETPHIRSPDESGYRELKGLYSMAEEMVRNSALQAEGINKILSELLQLPLAGNDQEPSQRRIQPRRPREQRRRSKLDLDLKVRSVSPSLGSSFNALLGRLTYVNTRF